MRIHFIIRLSGSSLHSSAAVMVIVIDSRAERLSEMYMRKLGGRDEIAVVMNLKSFLELKVN